MISAGAAPWLFCGGSLVGAWFTYNALRPYHRAARRSVASFFAGWLTTELALHHFVWQLLLTAVFVWAGALAAWPGIVGLAITLASWAGLVWDVSRYGIATFWLMGIFLAAYSYLAVPLTFSFARVLLARPAQRRVPTGQLDYRSWPEWPTTRPSPPPSSIPCLWRCNTSAIFVATPMRRAITSG